MHRCSEAALASISAASTSQCAIPQPAILDEEQGILAEATSASWRACDAALAHAIDKASRSTGAEQAQGATKARRALRIPVGDADHFACAQ
jgi:hypothetical protein